MRNLHNDKCKEWKIYRTGYINCVKYTEWKMCIMRNKKNIKCTEWKIYRTGNKQNEKYANEKCTEGEIYRMGNVQSGKFTEREIYCM